MKGDIELVNVDKYFHTRKPVHNKGKKAFWVIQLHRVLMRGYLTRTGLILTTDQFPYTGRSAHVTRRVRGQLYTLAARDRLAIETHSIDDETFAIRYIDDIS